MADIIDDLELSVRASNVLRRRGRVETLDDFMALTKSDILAQPNAGTRTWREIEQVQKWLGRQPDAAPSPNTALRDAAALAALPAIVDACRHDMLKQGETREQMFARRAFEIADAFIAARATGET